MRLSRRVTRLWPGVVLVPAAALTLTSLPAAADAAVASPSRPAVPAVHLAAARSAAVQAAAGPLAPRAAAGSLALAPAIPAGSGPAENATFLHFPISDKVSLQVNAGSGDALLTTSDITVHGSPLTLGASYNSLLVSSGVATGEMGAYGWRQREGADVQLYPADDGSVTFLGQAGTAGKFTPAGGGGYTSPPVFHATLAGSPGAPCSGSAYSLTWHATGEIMCFTSGGILTSEADRNGNTTAYSYNSSHLENQVTYTPHGASSPTRTVTAASNGYWLQGLAQSGGTAGTKTVTYTLNQSAGDLASVKQADGTLIQFGYDGSHNLTSVQNGAQNTTRLTYNSAHQVTSVTQQTTGTGTGTTRLDYVSPTQTLVAGPDTNQADPVPSVPNVTYTIDPSAGLVTRAVDQQGNTRSASYTSLNDLSSSTNGQNGQTKNTYGPGGNGQPSPESLTSSQSPTGATSALAYGNSDTGTNPTGEYQPSGSTDSQANTTAYTYDGAGNTLQAANALPAIAKVSHNSDGTPATSTAPAGGITTYSYTDGNHELNKVTPPAGGGSLAPETVTYDGFGRVSAITGGDGNTLTYTYDLADRITQAAYTGGPNPVTVTYAYNGAGNLKTQTDPSGTTTYGYDGRNLATAKTATSGGGTLNYGYDAAGNLAAAQDAGGTTTYTYDTRNQLTEMTDPTGKFWQFAYNPDGLRTTTWFATPTATSTATWAEEMVTSYDKANRITKIAAYQNSSTANVVSSTSYCHSTYVSGQACGATTPDTSLVQYSVNNVTGAVSQDAYDTGNRLKSVTSVAGGQTYSYGYDANGNITSGTGIGNLTYNTDNQITSSGYAYDGAGKQTQNPANGTQGYNDAGQMTTAGAFQGPEHFTYAGTGQDNVLSFGTGAGVTYGLTAADGQPWIQGYHSAAASQAVYILHDQQGTPLGLDLNGKYASAFITDNIGSVTALVNASGATAANYAYGPYGNIITRAGAIGAENLIGYTGALTDLHTDIAGIPSTSYAHLGDRWYNPATGSFNTQDPQTRLGNPADANAYAYAADNPANNTDPTGQCGDFFSCGIGFILAQGTQFAGVGAAAGGAIGCAIAGGPFDLPGCTGLGGTGIVLGGAGGFFFGIGFGIGEEWAR